MRTIADPVELQTDMLARRARAERIGFVPTMGFLHDGHLSLMDKARALCDHLVVSIYVNPLQFGPAEDLDRYPSDPEGDAKKCISRGVDTLFLPPDLYEQNHSTSVTVDGLSTGLCGTNRPGHFNGVTTVVARLFGLVQPTLAVFGEKDYQQLAIIRRMVRDLGMSIDIVGGALIRDDDGLALSSRNTYLSPKLRQRALSLHKALYAIRDAQTLQTSDRLNIGRAILDVDKLDYLEIVDPESLAPIEEITGPARAMVAGWIGKTRLIDNIAI
jgi:pantoate--beta-alanine ligase